MKPLFTRSSPAQSARQVWRDDPRHAANHLVTVALTGALGIAVLVSNPTRFSSASYTSLHQSGGMTLWAIVMIVGAVWLLAAMLSTTWMVRWSLLVTGILHLVIAGTFVYAQNVTDGASPWGWLLFGGLAIRHGMQSLWFARTRP